MMTPEEIITEEQLERVHANANFGPHRTKRYVLNRALLQTAHNYHTGHTAKMILEEHGLTLNAKPGKVPRISAKGQKYLKAVYGDVLPSIHDKDMF